MTHTHVLAFAQVINSFINRQLPNKPNGQNALDQLRLVFHSPIFPVNDHLVRAARKLRMCIGDSSFLVESNKYATSMSYVNLRHSR